MSFSLTKPFNSLATPTVIPVELNDTDIDRMITRILEMAVKRGRVASSSTDTRAYHGFLTELQSSDKLVGFDGERGRDILDGWVRASILKEERSGLRRSELQMGYIRPLTIAAYRSGLPKTASRNRRADALTYQAVLRVLESAGSANSTAEAEGLFVSTFGQGVDLGVSPWHQPRYDGTTPIDIDTLLALRFIEGFNGSQNLTRERQSVPLPVPQAAEPIGHDLVAFLRAYGPSMPVAEAFAHVSAVIALRLFQLPLITARVLRGLLSGEPVDLSANQSEMYCDFVRRRGSASDEISRMAVIRDLEVMRTFFRDRLLIRAISEVVPVINAKVSDDSAEQLLADLAGLASDPAAEIALGIQLNTIYMSLDEDSEGRTFIDDLRKTPDLTQIDRLSAVLVEGLRGRGLENQVKWFHSTGGITKSYGILSGSLRARSTWRYAPSDEVLTTLLCLCFTDNAGQTIRNKLPIREVLNRLESRFGVLIDRPPVSLDSADTRAGAAENLTAFTRQLKLLGCFEGLSDDFSAQFVTNPRGAYK